jgi:hypothetical protein
VEVQRHRIRPVGAAGVQGLVTIRGSGDDVEPLAAERVGEYAAH